LAHPHARLAAWKLAQQHLHQPAGEPLDQLHALPRADLDDARRDEPVVDGGPEVVRRSRGGQLQLELDVDAEPGADVLLGRRHAVVRVEAYVLYEDFIRRHGDCRGAAYILITGFLRLPMPSMRTSTLSPGRIGPLPPGVPVAMTSPGCRVMTADTRAMT